MPRPAARRRGAGRRVATSPPRLVNVVLPADVAAALYTRLQSYASSEEHAAWAGKALRAAGPLQEVLTADECRAADEEMR